MPEFRAYYRTRERRVAGGGTPPGIALEKVTLSIGGPGRGVEPQRSIIYPPRTTPIIAPLTRDISRLVSNRIARTFSRNTPLPTPYVERGGIADVWGR